MILTVTSPLEIFFQKEKKMANDNHLLPIPYYNGTMLTKDYYNNFFEFEQQKINFNLYELALPHHDPVYTLKKVMEDLDFSGLLACYSDQGRTGGPEL
ncbi:hypothetical protein C808_04022 [Lachnospiraceae bacterium M18-1]|nr:hypothetical protein C808_04022 [Lachnospiraceae bacterium M18-1]